MPLLLPLKELALALLALLLLSRVLLLLSAPHGHELFVATILARVQLAQIIADLADRPRHVLLALALVPAPLRDEACHLPVQTPNSLRKLPDFFHLLACFIRADDATARHATAGCHRASQTTLLLQLTILP